jgi:hypothetical protein
VTFFSTIDESANLLLYDEIKLVTVILLLAADVNKEDVCDMVLDKGSVEEFERAVDEQVSFILMHPYINVSANTLYNIKGTSVCNITIACLF